ncbi:MAG TPA: hypothetical protein VGD31_02010 [Sphingobacteriaceae bacterium]
MKRLVTFVPAILCAACAPSANNDSPKNDSTVAVNDSVATPVIEAATEEEVPEVVLEGGLTIKDGDTIIYVPNQWAFISDPYDFSLDTYSVRELLGDEVTEKVEEFEGGEDYDPYSFYTLTYGDTKLQFYSYPGKHFSTITTPLLPLKNEIKIGMTRSDFLKAMNFKGDSLSYATLFTRSDDYGYMNFRFRADTLNLIYASWEEGD